MKRLILTALCLVAIAACASRDAVLARTAVGLEAARAAFTAEDERQQMAIVAAASSKAEAEAAVAAHRQRRDVVTKVFQAAWAALAAASLDPSDANMQRLAELAALTVASLDHGGGAK